ncbi:MAG: hypothetical protein WD767_07385 [Alphaproteobacteria bacterium]
MTLETPERSSRKLNEHDEQDMSKREGRALLPLTDAKAAKPRPFFFIATFWGKQFRDWFCLYAVSSLLAKNNIPSVNADRFSRFLICTTREDWDALQRETIFRKLREAIDVVFIENDALFPGEHKYHRMSRGHAMLANECFKYSAVAININPDSIYPDGCVREAKRLLEAGKNVVLCTAVRFELEGVRDELGKRGLLKWGHALTLPMREAVEIGLSHLHSETRASDWAADNFGRLAPEHERTHLLTCCFWRAPRDAGCIIITHNWAPFLINYASLPEHSTDSLDGRAIDGNYIYDNFRHEMGTGKIHVVTDSDDIFLLGLSPKHEMVPPQDTVWWKAWPVLGHMSRGYILNQTVFDPAMDPLKRILYRTKVRWHKADLSSAWDSVDAFAQQCMNRYTTCNLNVDNRQTDMYADDSPVSARAGGRFHDRIWFRLIGRDAFRPYGSPTRLQFVQNKIREKIRSKKAFLYFRATLLALKGDTVARRHFTTRWHDIRRPARRVAVRTASVFSFFVVGFLLANIIAYALIQFSYIEDFNDSKSDKIMAQSVLLRMESQHLTQEQRDAVDRMVPDISKNVTFIIGDMGTGHGEINTDSGSASIIRGITRDSGKTYLALDTIDDRITLQLQSLLAVLENGLRPEEVIVLFNLDEIADAIFQSLKENNKITEPSWAASFLDFLPLVRFSGKRFFDKQYETDPHPGYEEYSLAEERMIQELDEIAFTESYRTRLRFIEQLSAGFGFDVRAYYLPSGLMDPHNQHISPSFRESRFRQFLTRLHERIRTDISNGTIRMQDMSQVFAGMTTSSYRPDGNFSPEGIRRIAKVIATETYPAQR